jgi:hypothetical protein
MNGGLNMSTSGRFGKLYRSLPSLELPQAGFDLTGSVGLPRTALRSTIAFDPKRSVGIGKADIQQRRSSAALPAPRRGDAKDVGWNA